MTDANQTVLSEHQVHLIVKALADPRRYEILKQLRACQDRVACEAVRECHEVSPATLSHHMKELETAGLIEAMREGRFVSYRLRREILDAFFDRLKTDLR